jgi:hypothetical protein
MNCSEMCLFRVVEEQPGPTSTENAQSWIMPSTPSGEKALLFRRFLPSSGEYNSFYALKNERTVSLVYN